MHKILVIAPLCVASVTWSAEIEKWEHLHLLQYSVVTSQMVDCFANVYDVEKPAVTGYENVDHIGELLWALSKSRQVLTDHQDKTYFSIIEKKYKDEILKILRDISNKIVDEHFTEISNICKAVFEGEEFLDVELNAFYNNLISLCLN